MTPEDVEQKLQKINDETVRDLKSKIVAWLDYDDKIKDINKKAKKYKDAKKNQEETIINMITKLELNDAKINILRFKK